MNMAITLTLTESEVSTLLPKLAALFATAETVSTEVVSTEPPTETPKRRARKDVKAAPESTTKDAFDKIEEGLIEALAIAKGEAEPVAPPAPVTDTVVAFPGTEGLSAFDAIMAAQTPAEEPSLTVDEYRNGIRTLTIEKLGIRWAKANFLSAYGHLNDVPEAELPALYAKAQRDARAQTPAVAEVG